MGTISDYFPSPLETESPNLTQPPNSCSKERGNEIMVDKKILFDCKVPTRVLIQAGIVPLYPMR
ncbi:hypothetical protein Hanom_Chr06g00538521 [Helianthus anomalus]